MPNEAARLQAAPLARLLTLVYGSAVYTVFFATFCYLIGWTGNLVVPLQIDGPAQSPVGMSVLINVSILALFAVQHTIMARGGFKRWWTRFVPWPIERATFVMFTVAILIALVLLWRPLPDVVWQVENQAGVLLLRGLFFAGWGIVLLSTFIIDHFDLFGLKQTIYYAQGKPYPAPVFKEVSLYRYVRHPLMLGFLIAFWAAPVMSQGHLLFAVVTTVYILLAIQIEERELVAIHGEDYERYRRRVSMLVPRPGRSDE
jgi:protein-S-isoprenylcysteine O-methyltransferase Ste14